MLPRQHDPLPVVQLEEPASERLTNVYTAGEGTSMMSGTSRGMFMAITLRWICSSSTTIMGHSVRVLKLVVLFARVLGALSPPSNSSVTEPGLGENAGCTISTGVANMREKNVGNTVAAGVDPVMVEFVSKASLTMEGMLAYMSKTKSRKGWTSSATTAL